MYVAVHGVCDMVPDPDAPYNVTGTVDFVQAVVSVVVLRHDGMSFICLYHKYRHLFFDCMLYSLNKCIEVHMSNQQTLAELVTLLPFR